MLCSAQKRIWTLLEHQTQILRRHLATEAPVQYSLPQDPSPEFASALKKEQRQQGIYEEEIEKKLSDEEQQAEYDKFLEKQVQVGPERKQLNIAVDPTHGLWAFFRQIKKDEKLYYETVEPTVSELLSGKYI